MSLADIIILSAAAVTVAVLIIVKVKNFTKKSGGCGGCNGCPGCKTRDCTQCAVKETKKDGTEPNNDRFG